MKAYFNTMIKNEEDLLKEILPIWIDYPIDKFVFYDDNSTDESINIIRSFLPESRLIILNDKLDHFNESHNRNRMLELSRNENCDYVLSIDCDELLSSNLVKDFSQVLKIYEKTNLYLFWYNVVNNSLGYYRNDPSYQNNYRSFILPLKKTKNFDLSLYKYHTPRVPEVDLPMLATKEYGVIHLQAINLKYYATKQLWYKHYEYLTWNHEINFINNRYDPVVNNLDFKPSVTPKEIIEGINFNQNVYKNLEIKKGYYKFVKENLNLELLTFGKEFIL